MKKDLFYSLQTASPRAKKIFKTECRDLSEFEFGSSYKVWPLESEITDTDWFPSAYCESLGRVREMLRTLLLTQAMTFSDEQLATENITLWASVFIVTGPYATGFRAFLPVDPEFLKKEEYQPRDYIDSVIDYSIDEAMCFGIKRIERIAHSEETKQKA